MNNFEQNLTMTWNDSASSTGWSSSPSPLGIPPDMADQIICRGDKFIWMNAEYLKTSEWKFSGVCVEFLQNDFANIEETKTMVTFKLASTSS